MIHANLTNKSTHASLIDNRGQYFCSFEMNSSKIANRSRPIFQMTFDRFPINLTGVLQVSKFRFAWESVFVEPLKKRKVYTSPNKGKLWSVCVSIYETRHNNLTFRQNYCGRWSKSRKRMIFRVWNIFQNFS